MYFSFKGHIFRQSEGLSIDSSISGILAILFMDKRSFLKTTDKRYVDHIYLQTTNEEMADQFLHAICTSSWKLRNRKQHPTASHYYS